ncbi:Domain present in ubiquitin-regulatory proteins [Teratosphaeria destructans]|uniref:Domain present in ubiquitin-regulatory proteins n=1 Tax=Teratosphaeria destructans TaxID=418781 RepID=A0A9W7SUT9_9PEZI|nr:Domain present in ubiquitin-regulatory proteins [Teratosphaeria destructans]
MFHSGDLNSGISLAIQQQKLVACFIACPSAAPTNSIAYQTSRTWEQHWLPELKDTIVEKAVLLRLELGSKEAGFLGAFTSIDKAPTLVVIHNGQVLEKLESGISQEDSRRRLLKALGVEEEVVETAEAQLSPEDNAASSQPEQSQPTQSSTQSANLSALFPDRAARTAAQHASISAAEQAALQARQEARKKEAEEAYAQHRGSDKGKRPEYDEKQRSRDTYLLEQKKRKEEAKRDRERILKQIENDKEERRLKAQQAKEKANADSSAPLSSPLPESRQASNLRSSGAGGSCQLVIRLFDGSSVRGRFPTSTNLATGVRDYIKAQSPEGGADIPYTFRQILAPQPSRTIEVSEEHESLAELGLTPNATLVLVPVAGSVDAYAASNSGVTGWLSSAYNLLPSISSYLPSFGRPYMAGTSDPIDPSTAEGARRAGAEVEGSVPSEPPVSTSSAAGGIRVKTLADQRAEAERKEKTNEFYNGNSSAFEGRKGDGAGEEEDFAGGR